MDFVRKRLVARVAALAVFAVAIAALAAFRTGKVLGFHVTGSMKSEVPDGKGRIDGKGHIEFFEAGEASGYGGPVPVRVSVRDDVVEKVEPILPNDETPMFFGFLEEDGLWSSWDGISLSVAVTSRVDAVAGATYSSDAAIENARVAFSQVLAARAQLESLPEQEHGKSGTNDRFRKGNIKKNLTLIAACLIIIAPMFRPVRRFRAVFQVVSVAVLGFWSGAFLSHDRLLGWAENGLPSSPVDAATAGVLLVAAFAMPLFSRPGHYCAHVCPFGAAQELAARIPVRKMHLSRATVSFLSTFRRVLWISLVLSMVLGLTLSQYEVFGAFAWRVAPTVLIALGIISVAVSATLPRAYCRFVCPTGTLLKTLEPRVPQLKNKEK